MARFKLVLSVFVLGACAVLLTSCGGGADAAAPAFGDTDLYEYMTITGLREVVTQPYVSGKVIVIEKDAAGKPSIVPAIEDALPEGLRVTTAADKPHIGTVIWVKTTKNLQGEYMLTGFQGRAAPTVRGYSVTMTVTVIDYRAKKIIATKTFKGKPPPDSFTQSSREHLPTEFVGEAPFASIASYVGGLPRK